jgi:hypothetical protein
MMMEFRHIRRSLMLRRSHRSSFCFCLLAMHVLIQWCGAHPDHEEARTQSGASALADAVLKFHPYLVAPESRLWLESLVEDGNIPDLNASQEARFVDLLKSVNPTVSLNLTKDTKPDRSPLETVALPGDRGGVLFKVFRDQGPVSFGTTRADLARADDTASIPIAIASTGTTWTLLTLEHVPDGLTTLSASFNQESGSVAAFPFQVTAPGSGRLRLTVLSDDTGEPTPAMVQLKWLFDGSLRAPDNAVDLTSQFDSLASSRNQVAGSRSLELPGLPEGDFWIVPGPVDMMVPPGQWQISILRGTEHLPVSDIVQISSGETAEKSYQPKRWTDMAARGWYSGDDHVHAQVMSQSDADKLITWALAEDLKVVNLLEMGDHTRTFFQQRAFGPEGRIQNNNTILVPGQEDPRTGSLGHTIALNIPRPVRDTSRYYLHDWVYDQVHELGGLYGYAHVNRRLFNIHRDMTLNVPKQKVDFVELLQFHDMDTGLYYEFLDLGFKVTASAGSDVPWGGSMGEVRVYAFLGDKDFNSDAWFQSVQNGHTFVTNGPMIEFSVDSALPGDEIQISRESQRLKVKARAWGHPDRVKPIRLEIVKHGEIIEAATDSTRSSSELRLEFELKSDQGCWLAARAYADDGSSAHTTPVYVSVSPLRFWDFDQALELIDRRMRSLDEIEHVIDYVRESESKDSDGSVRGALIGQWYGSPDLTRPRGMDILSLPGQIWPEKTERGGEWSVQWKGTLTLPVGGPGWIDLFLDSGGPSSLSINGEAVVVVEAGGEESARVELQPGQPAEVNLVYANLHTPGNHINLSWSAEGIDKQPVPADWFAYRTQDRAAFRYAAASGLGTVQLREQAELLLERVDEARLFYEDLRIQWRDEMPIRGRQ